MEVLTEVEVNRRAVLRIAGWMLFLLASLGFLVLAGGEQLAAPPLRSPGDWGTWLAERDPATVAVALLRVGGIVFGIYLLTITALAVLASALRSRRLTKASSRLAAPWLRHTLGGLLGAGLVVAGLPQQHSVPAGPEPVATGNASTEVAAPDQRGPTAGLSVTPVVAAPATQPSDDNANGTGSPPSPDPGVVMSLLADDSTPEAPPVTAVSPPTMSLADDADTPGTGPVQGSVPGQEQQVSSATAPPEQATTGPGAQPEPAITQAPPDVSAEVPDTWVIEPGEHLWRVAESVVTDELGRPPTEAEIAAYWTVLIESNRAMLVDPSNPDLVFAGQVLTLPPVEA
ncbi:MAG: hypothetical protein JJLCMIEE_00612 [Acidimicrobiales bacterium]|nr:MAG: hypothetical protein EDR02_02070 [Actinomycetota bacterium]MBV6507563.1 hypothetical protein [Acidimicrobiales bacterium]RIK07502.1 MAG: hypothetical protein DCC48_03085 [Acidobacteriota bacterium]